MGNDGQTHEVTADAGNAKILQQEIGEQEADECDDQGAVSGALDLW